MQQRRGTSTQWTATDPILAAGEIGFELDSGQFKMGDGVNHWSDLAYFKDISDLGANLDSYLLTTTRGAANGVASLDASGQVPMSQLTNLTAGAPAALDTLNELAAALDNDASFSTKVLASLATKAASTALVSHVNTTTSVHGIADTAELATKTYASSVATNAQTAAISNAATDATNKVSNHNSTTTSVHGISDTSVLETVTGSQAKANSASATAVSNHNSATTSVHGIADTSALATKTYADSAATTAAAGVTKSSLGLENVTNTSDANKPVSTAQQTALDLKANLASPTFTGTVGGITKAMVGLGNVDNTADTAKPVSTAQQTALDLKETVVNVALKAPLASPALTGVPTAPTAAAATNTTQIATTAFVRGEVTALVNGATAALDTLGELAAALTADEATAATLATLVGTKAPLASPTFTGTVTIPAGASISGFAPLASPTFTGTNTVAALTVSGSGLITASSAGIAFTDGTQTKEGVVSRTPIVQKTASYTLSALTERDSLIEVASASAVTITVPTNATVAYPVGTSIDILQTGAGQITVAGAGGVTVNATPGLKLRTQWSGATLFKRATDTWVLYGDLSA